MSILEMFMTILTVALQLPIIPREVQTFADENGVSRYLASVIDLARQVFPASTLNISLGRDAEDETHQYIALDVEVSGMEIEELLAGQRAWSAGISQVCPSRYAVYFVLSWR
jgi:hypothetical protein